MNDKLLKILKKIVGEVAGTGSEKIVDLLYKKTNVNEFLIAKKLGGTINQTRNLLYKLSDKGLVEFIRKKDKKKGGWYTYYWTLKTKRILQLHRDNILKEIQKLQEELKNRENARFFICGNCGAEYDEEAAMLNDFTCPECGEVLQLKDIKELTANIKTQIEKLESSLAEIDKEIEEIEVKEKKLLDKKLKIEAERKLAERKKARKKLMKLKKQTKKNFKAKTKKQKRITKKHKKR